ncbi:MAG: heparan-alpha-glucosaminide N-acetyltransferase [Halobacteriales archaeon]
MARRLWEVDGARGFALALMLLYNWSFALRFLDVWTIAPPDDWFYWWLFPRFIGFLFVFIAGVSLTLSVNRLRRSDPGRWREIARRKYPMRGLRVFAVGLAITVATFVLYPDRFVYFGVLHLIGFSIVASVPVLTRRWTALGLAAPLVAATVVVGDVEVNSRLLGAIGFDAGVPTLDHFPIVPWAGVALLGVWTGHTLFPRGERRVPLGDLDGRRALSALLAPLQFVGRHTLVIYLAHQPALGLVLLLLGYDVL